MKISFQPIDFQSTETVNYTNLVSFCDRHSFTGIRTTPIILKDQVYSILLILGPRDMKQTK